MTTRVPPHSLDAEESLLGAMMLSPDATRAALSLELRPDDFYKPAHSLIYAAAIALHERGAAVDPITLTAELGNRLDGGRHTLDHIQAATPASANAVHYAQIVAELSRRRQLIAEATELADRAWAPNDDTRLTDIIERLSLVVAATDTRTRITRGGAFTLDAPSAPEAIWGHDDRVLWARGESMLIVGPAGVGKTTLATQLVAGRIGLLNELLDLPVQNCGRVLYLACDRPAQIRRAFARLFGGASRDVLDEHLAIWSGPPSRDFATHPRTLAALARDVGADCVFIDSLKDVALGLSDDTVGAGLNSALQHALADGVDICALHHQRKGQAGAKPRSLEDVFGSTWITAGAGSVVLLWGEPGDPIVKMSHLKQPGAEVGPIDIDHDHITGCSIVHRGDVDPLRVLRARAKGMTARELAQVKEGREAPTDNQRRKAKRDLDRLVKAGLAHKVERAARGVDAEDRYYATVADDPARPHLDFEAAAEVEREHDPEEL